ALALGRRGWLLGHLLVLRGPAEQIPEESAKRDQGKRPIGPIWNAECGIATGAFAFAGRELRRRRRRSARLGRGAPERLEPAAEPCPVEQFAHPVGQRLSDLLLLRREQAGEAADIDAACSYLPADEAHDHRRKQAQQRSGLVL